MKTWLFAAALATTLVPAFARAEAEMDLADLLAPEDLEQEMAFDENADMDVTPTAEGIRLKVIVDKSEQRLYVYEDGKLTNSWLVSSGKDIRKCAPGGGGRPAKCYMARTPVGTWQPKSMHYNYTSRLWQARMDRAIFFTGGIALHATYGENIDLLGTKQSGGCVRQSPENADKMYRLVKQYGMGNTSITVRE